MLPRAAMNSREVVPMRDSDHIQNSAGIPQSPSAAGDFDQRRSREKVADYGAMGVWKARLCE